MRNTLSRWIERKLTEGTDEYWHECELCGDMDTTHAPLSTGEVVCWHCAEAVGEYQVPAEHEWRVAQPY